MDLSPSLLKSRLSVLTERGIEESSSSGSFSGVNWSLSRSSRQMEESVTQGEGVLATVHSQGAKFNGVTCDLLFAMLEHSEYSGRLPTRSGLIKKILERVSLKLSNKISYRNKITYRIVPCLGYAGEIL